MQLQVFKYEDDNHLNEVRTVEIDGEIWFVAIDVCELLEIANARDAVASLDDDEKLTSVLPTSGQERKINLINESGLYSLIFKSRKPSARKFKKWVTKEVLPAIRKTGTYTVKTAPQLIPTYQNRILSEPTKSCPRGYWTVFDKCHKVMLLIEKHIGSVNKYDLVDGSIGKRWSDFRQGKHWAKEPAHYMHKYEDNRGARECMCYDRQEQGYFEDWLEDYYIKNHLHEYLVSKYKREKNLTMLDRVHKAMPRLLGRTGS